MATWPGGGANRQGCRFNQVLGKKRLLRPTAMDEGLHEGALGLGAGHDQSGDLEPNGAGDGDAAGGICW